MNITRFKDKSITLTEINKKLDNLFQDLFEAKIIKKRVPVLDSIEIKFDFFLNKENITTSTMDAIEHAQRAVIKELFGPRDISGKLYRSFKEGDETKNVLTRHDSNGITLVKQQSSTNYFAFLFYNKTVQRFKKVKNYKTEIEGSVEGSVEGSDLNLYRLELRFYKPFFENSIKKKESSEDRKQFLLRLIRLFGIKLREKDPNYKNRFINSLVKQLKRISCETVDLEIYKDSENSGIVSLDLDLDGKDYIDARRAFT